MFCSQYGSLAAAVPPPSGEEQVEPRADTTERDPKVIPTAARILLNNIVSNERKVSLAKRFC